jgi:hypothetical protein
LGIHKQTIRRLNESQQLAVPVEEENSYEDEKDNEISGVEVTMEETSVDQDYDDYVSLKKRMRKALPTASPVSVDSAPEQTVPSEPNITLRNRFSNTKTNPLGREINELFGNRESVKAQMIGTEHALDDQREEHENITEDLLKMAKMLKESSIEFGKNLDDEKEYLVQAKEGLDRNNANMQSAGQKIEDLRKNETVGFIWSMIYMAIIVGLVSLDCICW